MRTNDLDLAESLLKLYNSGQTIRQIAESYGWSTTTIYNVLRQHPDYVSRRKKSVRSVAEKYLELYQSGKTSAEIGRIYGVSRQRVHQVLKKVSHK